MPPPPLVFLCLCCLWLWLRRRNQQRIQGQLRLMEANRRLRLFLQPWPADFEAMEPAPYLRRRAQLARIALRTHADLEAVGFVESKHRERLQRNLWRVTLERVRLDTRVRLVADRDAFLRELGRLVDERDAAMMVF